MSKSYDMDDLETSIVKAWELIDDLEYLSVVAGESKISKELTGLVVIYDMRFNRLLEVFKEVAFLYHRKVNPTGYMDGVKIDLNLTKGLP